MLWKRDNECYDRARRQIWKKGKRQKGGEREKEGEKMMTEDNDQRKQCLILIFEIVCYVILGRH